MPVLRKFTAHIAIVFVFVLNSTSAYPQYFKLQGHVLDSSQLYPLESISVITSSGKGVFTDENGYYEILVKETDSVWFSFLNKPTIKYAIKNIFDASRFDIALHVNIPELREVIVQPRNYRMDSLQNRLDYAKAFNWEKPKVRASMGTGTNASVGFDLEELIRMFQFRKNKSMASFRQRLIDEEREKFVDHRFSKALVLRLTGLTGDERDSFMMHCRPIYEFCVAASDYDFQSWIKDCYKAYQEEQNEAILRRLKTKPKPF